MVSVFPTNHSISFDIAQGTSRKLTDSSKPVGYERLEIRAPMGRLLGGIG